MDRPKHAGLRHLALNTRNLEAMQRFYVDFLGFAIEWQPDPRTHRDGARSCYVKDPDGNTIQIIHHPPISGR